MSKMNAKDSKESKGFEKLKQFFRMNKGGAGLLRPPEEFALSPELERDLCAETSMSVRTKTIKELSETVLNHRLEDHAIEKLWRCLEDLLHESVAREHRHLAFSFFRSLVQGQYERLGLMRVHFFRLVKSHNLPEDILPRLELLHSLTDGGRDIVHMEEEVGKLLVAWMPVVTEMGGEQELLNVLVNVIKYNAAYLDEDLIAGLVHNTCHLCCHSTTEQVVLNCLQVLDTIVCYNTLPSESLPVFVATLCRSVNIEVYCPTSWKIMRNLLGTHLGHASLYTMCRILQDRHSLGDVGLLRGAVFHINMALWGSGRVATLHCTPASVLPSFRLALECGHQLVMYEVMLSVQRLVNKCGLELQDPPWDTILSIVEAVIQHIEVSTPSSSTSLVANHLHEMLCTIEQLIELGQFNGSVRRVFQLIERCSPVRPEVSVLRLVSYLSGSIVPTCHLWINKLDSLMERYYGQETRTTIRLKALDVLATILENNRACYAEELIDRVVLPHLDAVDQETDVAVRSAVAQLLVDLCQECETKRLDIMDILDKLLVRAFDQCAGGELGSGGLTETEAHDVKVAVHGICRLFVVAIFQLPSAHAVRAYRMLVTHLEMHYTRPHVFDAVPSIRHMIFELLLNLRVDSSYRLGLADGRRFSPYLVVERRGGGTGATLSSSPPPSPAPPHYHHPDTTHLTLSLACRQIVTCLKQELDWKVVLLILQGIPHVMKNRALVLSRHGNDIDMLAAALCSMVSDRSLTPESLRNTPPKFTRSDCHGYVFPVLAALVSYHTHIEPSLQQKLIKCLEYGLASRSVCQCIMALTTCTLEMRDTMVKLLPEVLLNLSKISATVHIAMPILEFLSTLTRLPKVFANFVGDQYMSVFAISLRYTNPFKYNHYTVSLAHHVIAVWFLKCRLPFRREFVKFITSGLKDNVLVPFEEGQVMKTDIVNEDSSNRKRSSSLTEQGSRRRERSSAITSRQNLHATADLKPPIDEALMTFHRELTETCVDLMARYTFSTCSSVPKRHPTAERLLAGGQSMTWLLGNKLITVTTSGCSYKALRNGLCDKCTQICRINKDVVPQTPPSEPAAADIEGKSSRSVLKLPLTRSISNDISPLVGANQLSNSSTAASSPSEETKRGLEAILSDADSSRLPYGVTDKQERQLCTCWCQGWAEIYVRRPTGDMSWAMRLQNPPTGHSQSCDDLPLVDISTMLLPSLSTKAAPSAAPADHPLPGEDPAMMVSDRVTSEPVSIPTSPVQRSPSRHSSRDSVDTVGTDDYDDGLGDDVGSKSRMPVRRSNSSPEMSASWKNPFMVGGGSGQAVGAGVGVACEDGAEPTMTADGKKKQNYAKDLRVNCEAIPEELGTTPPLSEQTLLTLSMAHVASSVSVQTSHGEAMDVTKIEVGRASVTAAGTAERPVAMSTEGTEIHKTIIKINQPIDGAMDRMADVATVDGVGQKTGVAQHGPLTPTLPHLTSKPPLSPPPSQLSPRLQPKLTKASEMGMSSLDPSALPPLGSMRDRGHTISVMSPVRKPRSEWSDIPGTKTRSPRSSKEHPRSGVNPSFVFLQLYHDAHFGSSSEKPLLLSAQHERAVKNLDWIPVYETHTVGVLYVGPGQADSETDILRNKFGSLRYTEFLQRLGTLIKLSEVDPQKVFLGGLDTDDNDGKFAYVWQDDVTQVTFHVATLMPTLENDPHCTKKKKHIGNDYVSIVYNESGDEYNIRTVKCQFNFACVMVQPLEGGRSEVRVRARQELVQVIGHSDPKVVSDQNVAILARQLALHANLASMISRSLTQGGRDPYASNWLERLRQIKRIRTRVLQEGSVEGTSAHDRADRHAPRRIYMDDFTEYT